MIRPLFILVFFGAVLSCNTSEKNPDQSDTSFASFSGKLFEELSIEKTLILSQINAELISEIHDELVFKTKFDSITKSYISFLEETKENLLKGVEIGIPPSYNEELSQTNNVNNYFFERDGYSSKGEEFIHKTNKFRNEARSLIKDEKLADRIEFVLQTRDIENRYGQKISYLNFIYKDIPLISALAYITHKETSILEIELEYIRSCK